MLCDIYIVDEVMGAGKTSAMINMIKPGMRPRGHRYIYITPYLDEVKRVKRECGFYEPKNMGTKTDGLRYLLKNRRCIVTTHALFSLIDSETVRLIEEGCYRLIMDEAFVPITESDFTQDDYELAKEGKVASMDSSGLLHWEKPRYDGELNRMKKLCEEGALIGQYVKNFWKCGVMWQLPPKVLRAFYDIHILTYKFGGQLLKYYLDAYGFSYKYKYVRETPDGYELSDRPSRHARPRYGELIHVVGDAELNKLGTDVHALSKNWYGRPGNLQRAQKGLWGWLDAVARGEATRVLWTTFIGAQHPMSRRAPTKGFLACNARATNKYAGRDILAYMVNRYPPLAIKTHLRHRGVEIDEDEFALSEMLQWIFRSAVRNGEEIWIYVPSRRMRSLLLSWIEEVDGSAA